MLTSRISLLYVGWKPQTLSFVLSLLSFNNGCCHFCTSTLFSSDVIVKKFEPNNDWATSWSYHFIQNTVFRIPLARKPLSANNILKLTYYSPIIIRLLSYDSVWNLRYVTRYLRKLRRNLQVKTICLICTRCLKERRRKVNLQNEDRLDWAQSFAFSFGYSNTQFHTIKPIQIWYEKGRFFVRYFTLKPFFICVMHVKRAFVYLKSVG